MTLEQLVHAAVARGGRHGLTYRELHERTGFTYQQIDSVLMPATEAGRYDTWTTSHGLKRFRVVATPAAGTLAKR